MKVETRTRIFNRNTLKTNIKSEFDVDGIWNSYSGGVWWKKERKGLEEITIKEKRELLLNSIIHSFLPMAGADSFVWGNQKDTDGNDEQSRQPLLLLGSLVMPYHYRLVYIMLLGQYMFVICPHN